MKKHGQCPPVKKKERERAGKVNEQSIFSEQDTTSKLAGKV